MSKALYVVICSRDSWWVDFEGKAHGPFPSPESAFVEGCELARLTAHAGRESEVLVPDQHGRYRVEWSSRNEPHARAYYGVTRAAE